MSIPLETERKFLVRLGDCPLSQSPERIVQGYLSSDGKVTVRVRRLEDHAVLTIKDRSVAPGGSRPEFEYEIPLDHADHLLKTCGRTPVEKLRHKVTFAGRKWVIDQFLGRNAGLAVAEIELASPKESFPVPIWTEREVTRDTRFRNSALFLHPYAEWRVYERFGLLRRGL